MLEALIAYFRTVAGICDGRVHERGRYNGECWEVGVRDAK
jgi:hypothetical protein